MSSNSKYEDTYRGDSVWEDRTEFSLIGVLSYKGTVRAQILTVITMGGCFLGLYAAKKAIDRYDAKKRKQQNLSPQQKEMRAKMCKYIRQEALRELGRVPEPLETHDAMQAEPARPQTIIPPKPQPSWQALPMRENPYWHSR